MNLSPKDFYNDIKYNMDILAKTLHKIENPDLIAKGEKIEGIHLGFIDIFKNDIKELENMGFEATLIQELNERLNSQADKIRASAGKTFKHKIIEEIPLIQKKTTLDALVKKNVGKPATQSKLQAIANDYDMYPIRGDSHCFYRSVATSLIQNIDKFPDLIASLKLKLGEDNPYIKKDTFTKIEKILNKSNLKANFFKVISERKTSDELVKFLRIVASAYLHNQALTDENIKASIIASSNDELLDDYLADMTLMEKGDVGARYAGNCEIAAIDNLFGVKVQILDPEGQNIPLNEGEKPKLVIPLLFEDSIHFNLLVPKKD